MSEASGNIVTNLKLKVGSKNGVEMEFADNMKHAIKLAAYEFNCHQVPLSRKNMHFVRHT